MPTPIILTEEKDSLNISIGPNRLVLENNDLLSIKTDAIVCPVNQLLSTDVGLAKTISEQAGKIMHSYKPVFPEPFGKVVVVPAGNLKAKYIFMTVLLGQNNMNQLQMIMNQAIERAIRYAEFLRLDSIAFPVLGSPETQPAYDILAKIMLENMALYFRRRKTKIQAVFFSAFNQDAFEAFRTEAKNLAHL